MKKLFVILLICFNLKICYSQEDSLRKRLVGHLVGLPNDTIYSKIVNLISDYNKVLFDDQKDYKRYWSQSAITSFTCPDYLIHADLYEYKEYKNNIVCDLIQIYPKDNYWVARIGLNLVSNSAKLTGLIDAWELGVIIENSQPKLFPLITLYPFIKTSIEGFTLLTDHECLNSNAEFDKAPLFIDSLKRFFEVANLKPFTCYRFKSGSNFQKAMGLLIGTHTPNYTYEQSDYLNRCIYVLDAETFKHEVAHVFIGDKFFDRCAHWLDEGCATFIAGGGKEYKTNSLTIVANYFNQHPEIDLNNLNDFNELWIDNSVSVGYTLNSYICKLVFDKKGKKGLFDMLNYGGSEVSDYIHAIEGGLDLKSGNLNSFLRTQFSTFKY